MRVLLLMLLSMLASAQDDDGREIKMLALSGRSYRIERVGSLTNFHCEGQDKSSECLMIEDMDLQPQVDWNALLEKATKRDSAKKKPKPVPILTQTAVDRYGGPWIISLQPVKKGDVPEFLKRYKAMVEPDFPGYKLEMEDGKLISVDVLRKKEDWDALIKELGFDETGKKKGSKSWL